VPLSFPRHFVLLGCAALLQVMVVGPRHWAVPGLPLALQGALHALALVGAVPRARWLVRRTLFVLGAALLAGAASYAGLWMAARLDQLWHFSPRDDFRTVYLRYVALVSAPGALAYGFLVRAFWVPQLRSTDPLLIASACTAVMVLAAATLAGKEGWLIVLWWFSFSAALYGLCRQRVSADDGLREHRA
jgi:hypothetical protein